jgi:predicted amidohydrolase
VTSTVVAIAQRPPVLLDLAASLERAVECVGDAAAAGADLLVFPETWLTGYPAWVFGMAGWQDPAAREWHARLLAASPVLGAPDDLTDGLGPLRQASREKGITVVIGLNERAATGGTIFNSLATIGPDGTLLNLHRKLVPTHTERIVWGPGDAAGLRAVDTPAGRVGGLVCWEHWLPLARQALHASVEQIHVAAWPDIPEMHQLAARCYAFEGRCFVVSAGLYLTVEDIPEELVDAYRAGLGPEVATDGLLFDGGSAVIGPEGEWVVEPVRGRAELILASLDLSAIDRAHQDLDVVGHYARDDVFELHVDARRGRGGVVFHDSAG